MSVALRLGALALDGFRVRRSELRWLRADGYRCRAGEPVAVCTLAIEGGDPAVLAEERSSVRVTLAAPAAGRVARVDGSARGGILGWLPATPWDGDLVWARLDAEEAVDTPVARLTFHATRPMTELAGGTAFDGWADQARGWSEGWDATAGATLLGAGICEQEAVLRGYGLPFADVLAGAPGPVHVVHAQDEPLVPCARVLLEAARRTDAEREAIRADMTRWLADHTPAPSPAEWMFAAALMNALERDALGAPHDLVTRGGVVRTGPADAVCLSVHAELPMAARHKRLGYTLNAHGFRLAGVGPAIMRWLRAEFEPVAHGLDDVARDLRTLAGVLGERRLLVMNAVSTQGYERIASYRGFDEGTMRSLGSVRSKELNLLLHELSHEVGLAVVDADAIVAGLGMSAHLPDGTHGSEAYYAEVRGELLYQLARLGVRGFG